MNKLKTSLENIQGLTLVEKLGIRYVKFLKLITHESLEQLLYILKTNNLSFHFYDVFYPSMSDPGAYLSYSQEKNETKNCWSMTLGNHGWSGGIYHINESTIIIQLGNLVNRKVLNEIKIDNVAFFSHYNIVGSQLNDTENNKILEIHSDKKK